MLDDYTFNVSFLGGFLILLPFLAEVNWYFGLFRNQALDAIPTIGFSDPVLSYFTALRFYVYGEPMLKEGYEKTKPGGLFKIADFRRWTVLATGPDLIEDIKRAPSDVLSRKELFHELLQSDYTIGLLNPKDSYSTDIVRSRFSRDINSMFKIACEELLITTDELIPATDEWVKIPFAKTCRNVICCATNRVFVGAPLCRNREYQDLNINFVFDVALSALVISWFPKPLKRFVSRTVSNLPGKIQQEIEFVRPLVEERFAKMEEYGKDWDDKPNDLLMSFMTEAEGVENCLDGFARRLLLVNFAGIRTTALTITRLLYRLLANPEYLEPLREEAEAVIKEEGWTKAGMDKMHKIDSFLRETQRLDGFSLLPTNRIVMRPFTFSNGVTIPKGTIVSIPASSIHTEESIYSNPTEFDGFRFEKLRKDEQDTTSSRYQSAAMSNEYFPFGIGRYMCPGRYLATNEMKALFAYLIMTYDIKFEDGKGVPGESTIAQVRTPATANILFRARRK